MALLLPQLFAACLGLVAGLLVLALWSVVARLRGAGAH
jgi:hypothetical protein